MKLRTCVYDSPRGRRECWENGILIYAVDAFLLCKKAGLGFPIFFGANIGPFETGQIVGDPKAMKKWEEGE